MWRCVAARCFGCIRWRRAGRAGAWSLVVVAWFSTGHFSAFGGKPDPARLRGSPEFVDGKFQNLEPTSMMSGRRWFWAMREWLFGKQMRRPICALPMVTDTAQRLAVPPASGLRVTWLGHSTTLIEIDGATVLTDPDVERARLPVGLVRAQALSPAAAAAGPAAAARCGDRLARALRSPGPADGAGAGGARRAVSRAAGHRRASGGLGRAGRADRRARLVARRGAARRRAAGRDAVAALQRAPAGADGRAVDVVVDRRPATPRVLQRRHRPDRIAARGGAPRRAVRRGADRDRPVERRLGRHPPGPGRRAGRVRAAAAPRC